MPPRPPRRGSRRAAWRGTSPRRGSTSQCARNRRCPGAAPGRPSPRRPPAWRRTLRAAPRGVAGPWPVWKSTSVSGAPDNSSLSHFTAMAWPRWFRRAVRNRHRHAIEQASRRWRGGRRCDSARTRRKILISTQVGAAAASATARGFEEVGDDVLPD